MLVFIALLIVFVAFIYLISRESPPKEKRIDPKPQNEKSYAKTEVSLETRLDQLGQVIPSEIANKICESIYELGLAKFNIDESPRHTSKLVALRGQYIGSFCECVNFRTKLYSDILNYKSNDNPFDTIDYFDVETLKSFDREKFHSDFALIVNLMNKGQLAKIDDFDINELVFEDGLDQSFRTLLAKLQKNKLIAPETLEEQISRSKLTVGDLKKFLDDKQLPSNGKKSELLSECLKCSDFEAFFRSNAIVSSGYRLTENGRSVFKSFRFMKTVYWLEWDMLESKLYN
jgi:hypothetical protein